MESWEIMHVTKYEVVSDFVLRVFFEDKTVQVIDFLPSLGGKMFGPLRDIKVFSRVRLDAESRNLVWPNNVDFSPVTLHDWPQNATSLEKRAKQWEKASLSQLRKPSSKPKPRAGAKPQKPKRSLRTKP